MFKFDFSPSPSSPSEGAEHADESANGKKVETDKMIIKKLQEREQMSAQSCKVLDTSSTVDVGDEMQQACLHGHVDLHSSTMDGLHYILPQHTTRLSEKNTDLIPGVYEGGLKVWECSVDLCRFLAQILDEVMTTKSSDDMSHDMQYVRDAVTRSIEDGGSTLELGCGHGLPACLLLRESVRRRCKQSAVVFSDFNDFVLRDVTIPNARLNISSGLCDQQGDASDVDPTTEAMLKRSVFVGGDWMGLSHKLSSSELLLPDRVVNDRFDIILASETTYTNDSCQDTAYLMMKHLKVGTGVGLVATKRFYFGVGGGADSFNQAALIMSDRHESSGLRLVVRTIQSYDTGNANIRDLLEVRLVNK